MIEATERLRREFVNIGHRGASAVAPEHTTLAYDIAVHSGAHFLELDVQMTRDEQLVVVHDPYVDRIARVAGKPSSGLIRTMDLADLKSLDVGSWFNELHPELACDDYVGLSLLTLDEVLARYRHCARFCLELKHPAPCVEGIVIETLARHQLDRPVGGTWRVLLMSLDEEVLPRLHGLDMRLPCIQLFLDVGAVDEIAERLGRAAEYAFGIGPYHRAVDELVVRAAHAMDLGVYPYTVNEISEMCRLIELGVDGLVTDLPDRLYSLLRSRARPAPVAASL
jgi:glycerophosphoryl diester phosphodiesterase